MNSEYLYSASDVTRLEQLVNGIRNERDELFDELYRATVQSIHWNAVRILKNDADAWDVVQETYITAYKNLEKLQEPRAVKAWLKQIAVNISYHALRKGKNAPRISLDDEDVYFEPMAEESAMPEAVADREGTRQLVGRIIDQLPEQQKETIILFYFDEMTVTQIAALMSCSENTVKSRLSYARKKIEDQIRAEEERSGVRLYSVSPAVLLAAMELLAGEHPISESAAISIGKHIAEGCGYAAVAGAAVTGTTSAVAGTAATAATKAAGTGLGLKIAAGILAAAVTVGGVAGGVSIHRDREESARQQSVSAENVQEESLSSSLPQEGNEPADSAKAESELEEAAPEDAVIDMSPMLGAYYHILSDIAAEHGICESETQGTGLAYAELVDFDGDGAAELYLYYITEGDVDALIPCLQEELWRWDGTGTRRLFHKEYGNIHLKPIQISRAIAAGENNGLQLWLWEDHDVGMGNRISDVTVSELSGDQWIDAVRAEEGYSTVGASGVSDELLGVYGIADPYTTEIDLIFHRGSVEKDGDATEYEAADDPWAATWEDFRSVETEPGTPHWYVYREKQLADAGRELFRVAEDASDSLMAMSWKVNDVRVLLDTLQAYADTSDEFGSVYYEVLHDLADRVGFCTSETTGPGLAYAELIDFNNDGADELYLYYLDTNYGDLDEADYPDLTPQYFRIGNVDTVWCLHEQVWYWDGARVKLAFDRLHASNGTAAVVSGGRMLSPAADDSITLQELRYWGRYGVSESEVCAYAFNGTEFEQTVRAQEVLANGVAIWQSYPELMELYGISPDYPEEIDLYNDEETWYFHSGELERDGELATFQAADYPRTIPSGEEYSTGRFEAEEDTPAWYIQDYYYRLAESEELIYEMPYEPLSWKVNDVAGLLASIRPASDKYPVEGNEEPIEVYRSVLEEAAADDEQFGHESAALLQDLDGDGQAELIVIDPETSTYALNLGVYGMDRSGSCVTLYETSGSFAGAGTYRVYILSLGGEPYLGICYGNYDDGSISKWSLLALKDGSFRPERTMEFYSSYDEEMLAYVEWGWLDDEALSTEEYNALVDSAELILDYWDSEETAWSILYQ